MFLEPLHALVRGFKVTLGRSFDPIAIIGNAIAQPRVENDVARAVRMLLSNSIKLSFVGLAKKLPLLDYLPVHWHRIAPCVLFYRHIMHRFPEFCKGACYGDGR